MPLISPMEWTGSGTVHLKHVQHFRTRKDDGLSLSTQAYSGRRGDRTVVSIPIPSAAPSSEPSPLFFNYALPMTFIVYLRCHKPHLFHIAQSKVWPLSFYNIPTILQIAVKGYACFVCEKNIGGGDIQNEVDLDTCRACQNRRVVLSSLSGPTLVAHMSTHILHDARLK